MEGRNDKFLSEAAPIEPPRSRLYSLPPEGIDTPYIESLTSYINRLARSYRVSPRFLVAQEIIPHLSRTYHFQSSPSLLGAYCRSEAMSVNGIGETAFDWSSTLTQLTMRANLRDLTLSSWTKNMPFRGLLRTHPAWCPVCYQEWQEEKHPIYQPLPRMLQVVTVCLRHRRQLVEHCFNCRQTQSVIPASIQPGCCTQCLKWLGTSADLEAENQVDDETLDWQQWVVNTIEELRKASTTSVILDGERLANGLLLCSEIVGSSKQLASLVGLSKQLLSSWQIGKQTPSLERMLEFCYILDISPLLLITDNKEDLREALNTGEIHRLPQQKLFPAQPVNREQASALIWAVLDGRGATMGVRQLEKRLGLGARTLIYHFPQECALVTTKYQAYRAEQARQRMVHRCNEIRLTSLKLHMKGTNPTGSLLREGQAEL